MLRAAMAHPGVEIVAVNDPFVDAGEAAVAVFCRLLGSALPANNGRHMAVNNPCVDAGGSTATLLW